MKLDRLSLLDSYQTDSSVCWSEKFLSIDCQFLSIDCDFRSIDCQFLSIDRQFLSIDC